MLFQFLIFIVHIYSFFTIFNIYNSIFIIHNCGTLTLLLILLTFGSDKINLWNNGNNRQAFVPKISIRLREAFASPL